MLKRSVSTILFVAIAAVGHFGQQLPNRIRGYKLYNRGVIVRNASSGPHSSGEPNVSFESVNLASVALTGLTLTTSATLSNIGQSGTVDFLMFRDISINGMPVDIAEHRNPFKVTDTANIELIGPVELFISNLTVAKGAYEESIRSKSRWEVSGIVLVFGRFRKFGFNFKRVIPVRLQMAIDNPLHRF